MRQQFTGSLKLFRLAGIDVYLHWSWFLIALWQVTSPRYTVVNGEAVPVYDAPFWRVIEYLALFATVLAHEFGHSLACRSVGGTAKDIILWPLGGIAFVAPPMRPGAVLWSIAAGPLVNLVLIIPFTALALLVPADLWKDLHTFFWFMVQVNIGLFIFNMLPVYPLDGGQVLHSLLWFRLGRWAALQIAAAVGMVFGVLLFFGSLLLLPAAMSMGSGFVLGPAMLCVMALFITMQSAASYQMSKQALFMESLPLHADCACPTCYNGPPLGPLWVCNECGRRFDTFDTRGKCPDCGMWYLQTRCPKCGETHHVDRWFEYRPGTGLVRRPAEDGW
jgi:Zn-dependent protease